jgi:hypothetical protein
MPPIGTTRRGQSCRVDDCLWALEKTSVGFYSFGIQTDIINCGSGGTRIAISLQDKWIFCTVLEKQVIYFHNRRCSARTHLDSRLSYRFVLTRSGRQSRPSPVKLPP